jgi:hypothetical protein
MKTNMAGNVTNLQARVIVLTLFITFAVLFGEINCILLRKYSIIYINLKHTAGDYPLAHKTSEDEAKRVMKVMEVLFRLHSIPHYDCSLN